MPDRETRSPVYMLISYVVSGRRRHTRLTCDWSSDVCSSDLAAIKCVLKIENLSRFGNANVTVPEPHQKIMFIKTQPSMLTKKRIVQTSLRHRMRQSVRRLCIANNAIKMRWYDMIDFIWWSVTL